MPKLVMFTLALLLAVSARNFANVNLPLAGAEKE
jgi:hypothetical protein